MLIDEDLNPHQYFPMLEDTLDIPRVDLSSLASSRLISYWMRFSMRINVILHRNNSNINTNLLKLVGV